MVMGRPATLDDISELHPAQLKISAGLKADAVEGRRSCRSALSVKLKIDAVEEVGPIQGFFG